MRTMEIMIGGLGLWILLGAPVQAMRLSSDALAEGAKIPASYTCKGENRLPHLSFSDIPPAAKSLVMIVDDPDAPLGTWTHWLVWNLPPQTQTLVAESLPGGAQVGRNDFKHNRYEGPCPPFGNHHYRFKLFALDRMLSLPSDTRQKALEKAMKPAILSTAQLTVCFPKACH